MLSAVSPGSDGRGQGQRGDQSPDAVSRTAVRAGADGRRTGTVGTRVRALPAKPTTRNVRTNADLGGRRPRRVDLEPAGRREWAATPLGRPWDDGRKEREGDRPDGAAHGPHRPVRGPR